MIIEMVSVPNNCNKPDAISSAASFAPDLILLDDRMPGMDGPATLKELRRIPQLANVRAFFITANASPQEVEHFLNLGAADVIPKPFDPMTLAQTIQKKWEIISGHIL
jgi:CheY-like chemotaxis protein